MKKFLKITEYITNNKLQNKKDNEFEFNIDGHLIRSCVCQGEDKEIVKESFTNYQDQDKEIENTILPLNRVIIYDNKDIDLDQKLAYVFECPVCLTTIITSNKDLDYCPHCENVTFPFELLALVNTEQMEDIGIEHSDISDLIVVKDNKIEFIKKDDEKDI